MPEPINQTPRAPWTDAAAQDLNLTEAQLAGPNAQTVIAQQRNATQAGGVGGFATGGVKQLLGQYANAATGSCAGVAAALAGPGATLASLVEGYAKSMHGADQLNEAYRRDAVGLAVTWLAAGTLPQDFVQDRQQLYSHAGQEAGVDQGPANRLLTRIAADGRFDEARSLANAQAQAGRNTALQFGIDSQASLTQRLESDSSFRALYQDPNNVAFRLGVESAIWEAQHPARVD